MADHEINIVVKGKNQTGSTFSSLSQSITGINQALEIAMKVAQALKQAYDTAKEGASLLYAEERFDSLAKSIGTTADVLMKDLRDATHGMVSDAELMAKRMMKR
jgi:2-polyprenyl-6-methoxyphenol hydroxylase-like FAD-dependent oxidoreductase